MDGGPSWQQVERDKRFNAAMSRLACDRCKDLISKGEEIPKWAREWWEVHQADDLQREREREEARREKMLKASALAKLSPEEKEILGIREDIL
jgi:hypothetical protein